MTPMGVTSVGVTAGGITSGYKKHVDDIIFDHAASCGHSCVWVHILVGVLISFARGAQFALGFAWIGQTFFLNLRPHQLTRTVFNSSCWGADLPGAAPKGAQSFDDLEKLMINHSFVAGHLANFRNVTTDRRMEAVDFSWILAENIYFLLGVAVGHPILYSISDKFGRQPLALVSSWTMGALGVLMYWVESEPLFVTLRVFIGIAFAGSGEHKLWISEIVPFQRRSSAILALDFVYFVSVLVTYAVSLFFCSWRFLVLIVSLLPLLTLPFSCATAESFKWLESRNDFNLYPRVFSRFVVESEIPSLEGKTKTFKISEKDKRAPTDIEDEDLLFTNNNEVESRGIISNNQRKNSFYDNVDLTQSVPTTTNQMRKLHRARTSKAILAPFIVLNLVSLSSLSLALALVLAFGHSHLFRAASKGGGAATGGEAWTHVFVVLGTFLVSSVIYWTLVANGGRRRPAATVMVLLGVALGTTSAIQYLLDFSPILVESTSDASASKWVIVLKASAFCVLLLSSLALQLTRLIALEMFPVEVRGVTYGFIGGGIWMALLVVIPVTYFLEHQLVASIFLTAGLGVVLIVCAPFYCCLPNLSQKPLPQDMEDFKFLVDSYQICKVGSSCCRSRVSWNGPRI